MVIGLILSALAVKRFDVRAMLPRRSSGSAHTGQVGKQVTGFRLAVVRVLSFFPEPKIPAQPIARPIPQA